jgi:hypothetical protein
MLSRCTEPEMRQAYQLQVSTIRRRRLTIAVRIKETTRRARPNRRLPETLRMALRPAAAQDRVGRCSVISRMDSFWWQTFRRDPTKDPPLSEFPGHDLRSRVAQLWGSSCDEPELYCDMRLRVLQPLDGARDVLRHPGQA